MPLPASMRPGANRSNAAPQRAAAPMRSVGLTGAAALQDAEEEEQRRANRRETGYLPHRFWLPKNGGKGIIWLDEWFLHDEPGMGGVLIKEHDLPNAEGKRVIHELCQNVVPGRHCQWCAAGEKVKRRFIISVYEIGEWTHKTTGVVYPGSRRLLAIPDQMKGTFLNLQQIATNAGHTMRGMYLWMQRGDGETSYAIGEPALLEDGRGFAMMDWDQEVIPVYGNEEEYATDGKLLHAQDAQITPVDYTKVFALPDAPAPAQGRRPVAGTGVPAVLPGSRREAALAAETAQAPAQAFEGDADDQIDYGERQAPAAPQRPATGPPRRPGTPPAVQAPAGRPAARRPGAPAAPAAPAAAQPARRRAPAPQSGSQPFEGDS